MDVIHNLDCLDDDRTVVEQIICSTSPLFTEWQQLQRQGQDPLVGVPCHTGDDFSSTDSWLYRISNLRYEEWLAPAERRVLQLLRCRRPTVRYADFDLQGDDESHSATCDGRNACRDDDE